jgi:hypothetical protein
MCRSLKSLGAEVPDMELPELSGLDDGQEKPRQDAPDNPSSDPDNT